MKRLFYVSFILILSVFITHADTNGIWHRAEDVRPGSFGSNEYSGDYSFPNKIGIGTSSPRSSLEVIGNTDIYGFAGIRVKSQSTGAPGITFERNSDGSQYIGAIGIASIPGHFSSDSRSGDIILRPAQNRDIRLSTISGTDIKTRLIIKNNGDIGIGVDNPQAKLDINGGLRVNGDSYINGRLIFPSGVVVGASSGSSSGSSSGNLPPICLDDNYLQWDGTNWNCKSPIQNYLQIYWVDVNTVADSCRDDVNPDLEDNLPTDDGKMIRFINTCGNRYCLNLGNEYGGRVVEIGSDDITKVQCHKKG